MAAAVSPSKDPSWRWDKNSWGKLWAGEAVLCDEEVKNLPANEVKWAAVSHRSAWDQEAVEGKGAAGGYPHTPDSLRGHPGGTAQALGCSTPSDQSLPPLCVLQVKQIMEEAVTRKFVHEDSSHIISFCGEWWPPWRRRLWGAASWLGCGGGGSPVSQLLCASC